jgi:hypothetical protein
MKKTRSKKSRDTVPITFAPMRGIDLRLKKCYIYTLKITVFLDIISVGNDCIHLKYFFLKIRFVFISIGIGFV